MAGADGVASLDRNPTVEAQSLADQSMMMKKTFLLSLILL